jgi:hypothetical protein
MRRLVLLLSLALAAASAAGQAGTDRSGLYGIVTRGPITPVCAFEVPCDEPAAGAVLVFARAGHEVARTRVRQDGSYRIALPAGTYTVRAVSRRPLDPLTARVRAGRFRRVDFSIDTGIR